MSALIRDQHAVAGGDQLPPECRSTTPAHRPAVDHHRVTCDDDSRARPVGW